MKVWNVAGGGGVGRQDLRGRAAAWDLARATRLDAGQDVLLLFVMGGI